MKISLLVRAIILSAFLFCCMSTNLLAVDMSGLIDGDCSKCHSKITVPLSEHGGAHAESLSCQDCHLDHPRLRGDAVTILACSECHDPAKNNHFNGANCITCHNAHFPLGIDLDGFAGAIAPICLGCHEDPFVAESAHAESLQCNECHEQHATIPGCLDCHEGHSDGQIEEPCLSCHAAHDPVPSIAMTGLDADECILCHQQTGENFVAGEGSHVEQSCDECHGDHTETLNCFACHEGHSEQMDGNSCTSCHNHHLPLPAFISATTNSDDCIACHTDIAAGGAHQQTLGCVDCHQNHPPGEIVVVACGDCHAADDDPHFAVGGCVDCHDHHQPLPQNLSGMADQRAVCAGCHPQVEEQLTAYAGGHDQDCVNCHDRHDSVPSCLDCHEGHDDKMGADDCHSCHQTHAPELISFQADLAPELCSVCHEDEAAAVSASGAGHRDDIACTECHQQHPAFSCTECHSDHPQQGDGVPDSCFGCHSPATDAHFTVGNCQQCHDPHQPLDIDLPPREPHLQVCVSCHQPVVEAFAAKPSGHSEQDCSECHSDHKVTRICTDCHTAHDDTMTAADCQLCHQPHQPQEINLAPAVNIPKQLCAACHDEQAEHLAANGVKHQHELAGCVSCHPQHKLNGETLSVACNDCHPRFRRRHFLLEDCAGCHDPHQPLQLQFDQQTELKPLCVSCHGSQDRLLEQYPSAHSEFDCGKCHAGEHGAAMKCLDCHEAHIPEQKNNDCSRCHLPHQPKNIKTRPRQVEAVCVSCHQEPAEKLKQQGGAHKKKVCISCHVSHPPYGEKVLPACSSCHDPDDNDHFAAADCQSCHLAHQPLDRDMSQAENSAPVCLTCHAEVAETFSAMRSAHAGENCSSCHPQHGGAMSCNDCHEPHQSGQSYTDCLNCHSVPHAPNQVAFNEELPATYCQSCHATQVDVLASGETAHSELTCIECHAGEHGSALDCSSCHEPPHDAGLHEKYPDCLKCHIDPHDLADWRGGEDDTGASASGEDAVPVTVETENIPVATEAADGEDVK